MATHSNILAWRIPWTVEPGGLPSIGLQRVRREWSYLALEHWREVETSKYRHCHWICPAQDCLATVARPNINLKVNASFLLNPVSFHILRFSKVHSDLQFTQLCPTLCDPIDCSPPGSTVHGILQARVLEWVAISFSRESSQPRQWTWVSHIAGRFFTFWVTRSVLSSSNLNCQTPYSHNNFTHKNIDVRKEDSNHF